MFFTAEKTGTLVLVSQAHMVLRDIKAAEHRFSDLEEQDELKALY